MSKRIGLLATVGVLVVLVVASVVARAEVQKPMAAPTSVDQATSYPEGVTWNAPFIIQNIGTGNATISVEFREVGGNGSVVYSLSSPAPVAPGGTWTVRPQTIDESLLPSNKKYAVVVSSDQPIAAMVNELGSGGQAMAYDGMKSTSSRVYFADIAKDYSGWNTPFYVQNASSSAGSINVMFYNSTSGAMDHQIRGVAVPANSSYEVELKNISELAAGGRWSVVVTGTTNIVGVYNQVSNTAGQEFSANAFTSGGTTVYLPDVSNSYGGGAEWQTYFLIQNVGLAETTVTVEYYANYNVTGYQPGQLVATISKGAVQPGRSVTERPPLAGIPANATYSVIVRSTASDVAVNVKKFTSVAGAGGAMSYNGFTVGATKVYLPDIGKQYSSGLWETPILIQNMGSTTATVNIQYVPDTSVSAVCTGAAYTKTGVNIGAGASYSERPRAYSEQTLPSCKYAVILESTNSVPIQAVVNKLSMASGGAPGALQYEGLTQ